MKAKKIHMKRRFFIKKLSTFMVAMLVPILLVCILTTVVTLHYVKLEINSSSSKMIRQVRENVDLMLGELDSLSLNFDNDVDVIVLMKNLLKNPPNSLDSIHEVTIIKSFLSAPANTRPYIYSIYVYYRNNDNYLMTTVKGFTRFEQFYDTEWYKSFLRHSSDQLWTESRDIYPYSFQKIHVVSIYKRLMSTDGVIVLNILPEYIDNSLNSLVPQNDQGIYILDENNHILFQNNNTDFDSVESALNLASLSSGHTSVTVGGKSYSAFEQNFDRYGWKYVSIIPDHTLYQLPTKLMKYSLIIFLFTLIVGILLSYFFSRRNARQISDIISTIDAAETGGPLPPVPAQVRDEYGYIIQNILKTFIEQKYLKAQLSEKKYKAQLMEIQALQSQINPHFLYNTLNSIYWKCIGLTGSPNEVTGMIESLSDILAYSLSNPVETVTVAEEIRNSNNYVKIQKNRYHNLFNVRWEYGPEVIDRKIIKLLFQPFIENSIYHGFCGTENGGRQFQIKIVVFFRNDQIAIRIIDNGAGMEKEKLLEIRKKLMEPNNQLKHIGIGNTYKRLRLAYGDRFRLTIKSRSGFGTAIHISIPQYGVNGANTLLSDYLPADVPVSGKEPEKTDG